MPNEDGTYSAEEFEAALKSALESQSDLVKEAVEKARQSEKDKLYGRIETEAQKRKDMEAQLKELAADKAARDKEAADLAKKAADEAKAREEAELSAKDLIAKKEEEWAAKLSDTTKEWMDKFEQTEAQRQQERALLAKEAEFNRLAAYTQQRLAEETDNIVPQLRGFVNGSTQEEIDASIEAVKATSAEIMSEVQGALNTQRARSAGVSPTAGTSDPLGALGDATRQEDVASMTMQQYAAWRAKNGIGGAGAGSGLFS